MGFEFRHYIDLDLRRLFSTLHLNLILSPSTSVSDFVIDLCGIAEVICEKYNAASAVGRIASFIRVVNMSMNFHTGQVIQLKDVKFGKRFRFLLEEKGICSYNYDAREVKFDYSLDTHVVFKCDAQILLGVMMIGEMESNARSQLLFKAKLFSVDHTA